MDFGNLKVILGYFFKGNPMVTLLYTSADLKIDFTVSFEPVDGFWQFKSRLADIEKYIIITSVQIQWMDFKVSGVILG